MEAIVLQKNPRLIQSVQRALDIVNCFDSVNTQLSLTEISEKLGLNISTVHGLINTLSTYSYIVQNPENKKYKLGLEFLLKANLVSNSLDLKQIGNPFLTELTTTYHETTHLYVYQQEQIFCVDKVESPNNYFIISSRAGNKLPMHASASGKIFLAYMKPTELESFLTDYPFQQLTRHTLANKDALMEQLQKIVVDGYSVENEELEDNAYSIAAPILDTNGQVVATISMIGTLNRMKEKGQPALDHLLHAAQSISAQLGYQKK